MNRKIDIRFEFRVMGVNAYIPIVGYLLMLIYSILNLKYSNGWMNIIQSLEMVMPFFAGWYSVFLFQDVLEEMGSETIFTYPIKRYELGILRVLIFFIFYMFILALVLILIQVIGNRNIFLPLFIQFTAQGLFYSGLGFLCAVITSSSIWALTILIVYAVTQILTTGSLFKIANIYLFNGDVLSFNELIGPVIRITIFSLIFFIVAHVLFTRFKNFK
jgi:hypothetical protein